LLRVVAAAVRLFRLAAEQEEGFATCLLVDRIWEGEGVPQDYAKAPSLYRLAVEQGVGVAAHNWGLMFEGGLGVAQDLNEAIRMYRIAAAAGVVDAWQPLAWPKLDRQSHSRRKL